MCEVLKGDMMYLNRLIGQYKGLPKSIYVIFLARIVNSLGNFVMPFLTIFLTDNLEFTKKIAGRFLMIAAVMYVPGSIIGGKLCDHVGRKKILVIFQGLAALCFVPCAFLGNSRIIPWLLIASGFFTGAASPSHMAMVTDITNTDNRKSAFSLIYLGNNIGFALGPMIAGFLYRNHLSLIFVGDALTTFISLILVTIYIKETIPRKKTLKESSRRYWDNEKAEEGGILTVLLKKPIILIFSIIMAIFSFSYNQYTFSLPIQVNNIFNIDGPKYYGILMTVNALTVVFLTPVITGVTSRFKPTFSIFLGGIQYALGFGMIYFIKSMPMLVISTIIWTIGEVLVTTNSGVYIANNTPISHRGRFNAVLPIIMGMGFAVGPYLTGGFMDMNGVRNVWVLIFALSIIASFLMIVLHEFDNLNSKRIHKMDVDNR